MSAVEQRLASLGITLPTPVAPAANYVPFVRSGSLLVISGQLCFGADGKLAPAHKGKVGGTVSMDEAKAAARLCAINVLAQAKLAIGDLDRIARCIRLGGFINAMPDYEPLAQVMNGASDLMVEALGDKGRHARSTVGVIVPMAAAVEVEAMFEIAG
ncbi:MAG: RidA family protein [Beijerinckiaceae bacterium]|jgi:enamine deaminase RidA (YjgF/YER057c/UK114 family)|nr:RidA family protein [Beijerinckiaceae bacterium]